MSDPDDFGDDFGGFEAAEEAPAEISAPQASAVQWAAMAAAASSSPSVNERTVAPEAAKPASETVHEPEKQLEDKTDEVAAMSAENSALRKKVEELLAENTKCFADIEELKKRRDDQKLTYDGIQKKHEADLERVRAAGHDALAVVVEEYKEICKLALAEQRLQSAELMNETLKKEREAHNEKLKALEQAFQEDMTEQKAKLADEAKKTIEAELSICEEKYSKFCDQTVQTAIDSLKVEYQKEVDSLKKSIEEAVQEERTKHQGILDSEQKRLTELLNEQRKELQESTEEAVKTATVVCKDVIDKELEKLVEASAARLKGLEDSCRSGMEEMIRKQTGENSAVQRRSLVACDLFLQSASKQVQLLLAEKPSGDS